MSPVKHKRSSILKRQSTTADSPNIIKAKNIRFSTQKFVKEFHVAPDEGMQWGNSYQIDMHATHSSDGSDKSQRSSLNSIPTMSSMNEQDKENIQCSFMANTSAQNAEISMFVRYEEKARMNDYSQSSFSESRAVDLAEVNMSIEDLVASSSRTVLSPRKTIYFHKDDNLCVSIKDQVLLTTSNEKVDITTNNEDRMSLTLMEDELKVVKASNDLEIFDISMTTKPIKNKGINSSVSKTVVNSPINTQTITKHIREADKKTPQHKTPTKEKSLEFFSPIPGVSKIPILVPIINQKALRERDLDLMEYMMNSEPNQHLMTPRRTQKKFLFQEHSLDSPVASNTPIDQLNCKKVIFSASKQCKTVLRSDKIPSVTKVPVAVKEPVSFSSNDSMDLSLLGMPKFESTKIIHPVRATDFNSNSMNIANDSDEDLWKVPDFKALHQNSLMNEKKPRQTVFEASMQHSVEKIKRKSLFDSLDDTTTDLMQKAAKDARKTVVFETSMHETIPQLAVTNTATIQPVLDDSMNETVSVDSKKGRLTVFNGSINETGVAPIEATVPFKREQRQTIFDLKMEETFVNSPVKTAKPPTQITRRQTTYASNLEETFLDLKIDSMEVEKKHIDGETNVQIEETKTNPNVVERQQEVNRNRETVFDLSMNETLNPPRKSLFDEWSGDSDLGDDEIVELKDFNAINESYAKKVEASHRSQLEEHFKNIIADTKSERLNHLNKRKSVYTPVDMSETFVAVKAHLPEVSKNVKDINQYLFQHKMDESVANLAENWQNNKTNRKTIATEISMNETYVPVDAFPRSTSGYCTSVNFEKEQLSVRYHPSTLQRQNFVQEVSMSETFHQNKISEDNGFFGDNIESFDKSATSEKIKICENKRTTICNDKAMDEVEDTTEELLQPLRNISVSQSMRLPNFTFEAPNVDFSFKSIAREMESSNIPAPIPARQSDYHQMDLSLEPLTRPDTSTMNISAPHILSGQVSVIKETSQYSISEGTSSVQIKSSDQMKRKSAAAFQLINGNSDLPLEDISSNMEVLDDSIDFHEKTYFRDFLEITTGNIAATPLDEILSQSLASLEFKADDISNNTLVDRRINNTFSSNNDTLIFPTLQQRYDAHVLQRMKNQMLENVPESDYEQYLTKMNLPKLPKLPTKPELSMESYRLKMQESINIASKNRRLEDELIESLSKILPAIPSYAFLHKNLLEYMDEQREKEMKVSFACVTPCFPWAVGFVELLKNKIECEYSDKFCMENCWTHFSRLIKFTHKALPNFIINFKLRADQHLLTEYSTIPIFFEYVTLTINPVYKNRKWSKHMEIVVREFRELLNGHDNFTNQCVNSTKLFEFLDWYDKQVKLAIRNVKLLHQMIHKNRAVIKNIHGSRFIFKRCFTTNDVVDFKIDLQGVIANVSSLELNVTGRKNFNYFTKPLPPDYRGIYLVEIVLFNAEAFLNRFCVATPMH